MPYDKMKQEIDYFTVGPHMGADEVASAETTQKIQNEYSNVFTQIGCFKGIFLYKSWIEQSHIRHCLGTKLMHYRNYSKKTWKIKKHKKMALLG